MSDDPNTEDSKIVVDDDWKSQVEKEKEQLKEQVASGESDSAAAGEPELPPATFMILMSTLATQAMAAMGLIPDPVSGKPTVNRPMAKHFIDLLTMLQEKTKGNLTEEESAHLRDGLHQLRMIYVSAGNQPEPTEEPEKKSSIELP